MPWETGPGTSRRLFVGFPRGFFWVLFHGFLWKHNVIYITLFMLFPTTKDIKRRKVLSLMLATVAFIFCAFRCFFAAAFW